jgi:ACS family glucarate transporter-like MFS transporter
MRQLVARTAAATGYRIRWAIFAFLFAFGFLGYVQRTGVAIAAERMVPELGLTQVELGWLLNAFLIGYTVFQLPSAVLGQWFGARRTLAVIGLVTIAAASSTALAPAGRAGLVVFAFMLLARFGLGIAQSALYPVASGTIESWFPVRRWGVAQGLLVTGLWLGAACTPPLIAWLMGHWGWRFALIASSVPSLLAVILWYRYARDRPAEHRSVGDRELAELKDNPSTIDAHIGFREVLHLLLDRRIALLTSSYFLMNYVFYLVTFWCFLYLVQERHFTLLEGGGLASLPFLAAAIAAGVGGQICDWLCTRYGARVGLRVLPVVALPAAAAFLLLTGFAASDYLAVAALCFAFAGTELTEGTYWTATMRTAPTEVMASTAVLNTGGNLGGVVATPTIAWLSAGHHWTSVFVLGASLSVLASILWFFIDIDPVEQHTSPARSADATNEPHSNTPT